MIHPMTRLAAVAAFATLLVSAAFGAPTQGGKLPKIVSAPARVQAGQRVVILARVKPNSVCRLSVGAHGRTQAVSRWQRAPAGGLEFSWFVPKGVHGGDGTVTLVCSGVRRRAIATIVAVVPRRSKGHIPLARHIGVVAVSATEPRSIKGLGGGSYPPYGSVMVPGSAWYGGRGVNVISNGYADTLRGYWQCVELVERFIRTEGLGPAIYGNANQLYANAPDAYYEHHPNGSGYVPVPGDIIVLGGGKYGHVVVVDSVSASTVYVVEQNASASGRNALSLSGSTLGREYGMAVIGVLHARANHSAPLPPLVSPQPPQGPIGELGFIKLANTGSGTVEVHTDAVQGGSFHRTRDLTSDFSPADANNGTWELFGWANGAPELGFVKLRNTSGTVEVHWDTLQGGSYHRAGDYTSDFNPADAENGLWNLFGSANGAPELGFVKLRNTSGTVEGHADALEGSSYKRTADYASDFNPADAANGSWQVGDF
jgi:surface antigen